MFKGLHFPKAAVLTCVRWYLRYKLSYRDIEELMAERGVSVDPSRDPSRSPKPLPFKVKTRPSRLAASSRVTTPSVAAL